MADKERVALIEVLVDAFSTQPPVYAKPSRSGVSPPPPQPSSSLRDYSARPPPTIPASGYVSPPLSHKIHSPKPPPLPPHPNGPSQRTFSGTHSPHAQAPPVYTIPQQHLTYSYSIPHPPPSQQLPIPSQQPPVPMQPNLHVIEGSQSVPFAQPSSHAFHSPRSSSFQTQHSSQPPLHHESPPPLSRHPYPQTTRNYLEEDIEDIPALQHAQSSLPPPRPPNPEILRLHADILAKINSEYTALDYALNTDMQRLRTAQGDLLAGEAAIHDEMGRLQAVRDVCGAVADRYRTTIQSTEANLNELRRKGDPEVDELICSTSIVYNQLIDLVAEDNAIEDTIYHLHRALNAGKLDLEKFLRAPRALAEEQFMKRALAQKIVSLIPMGAWA
ncbi:hypothetical protein Clacol_006414 [Clathrus columnatus]|uniref:SB domain-containing protein n=1 Tax=Clathrus columnatus TaxID=1419009 RepID=A0AAV5AGB6_9AGAM|nr:hypothetical protein Clacol_006414 [Clathrus columnatus]